MKHNAYAAALLSAILVTTTIGATSVSAATVQINNLDSAGEGFNDATPVAPVGGNPGTTLGAQRLNAFQYAADLIGEKLVSSVTIVVNAQMNPLTCSSSSAVLGAAGANTVHANFNNAPMLNTLYPQALANSLAGTDVSPSISDIAAQFNSNLDLGCFSGGVWYYGFDENPGSDLDFVTVVFHEICHGLGFQTFVNLGSGAKLGNLNDTYMLNINDMGALTSAYPSMTNQQRVAASQSDPELVWVGATATNDWPLIPLTAGTNSGFARLHGPSPQQPGSSVSHWSTTLTPDEAMEPFYRGPNHSVGLALSLFEDIGWELEADEVSVTITNFKTRATSAGVEMSAHFASQFGATSVNIYRVEGDVDDNFVLIRSLSHNGSSEFAYTDASISAGKTYRYRIGATDLDGEFLSQISRVAIPSLIASLGQNVPNPFNPITTIHYVVPAAQTVRLTVYDASGRLIRNLADNTRGPGQYEAVWDGTDNAGNRVGAGVYFYRLHAGKFSQSRKMILLK